MIRSWSSGPSSSLANTGPVISDSEFCSEMSAFCGERSTLVLYAGAYAGGCTRAVALIELAESRLGRHPAFMAAFHFRAHRAHAAFPPRSAPSAR